LLQEQFPGFASLAVDDGMRGRQASYAEARAAAVEAIAARQAAEDVRARYKTRKLAGFESIVDERILREVLGMDDAAIETLLRENP